MFCRIKEGVDRKLRKEQACFRSGRGTTEHIFTLRKILEQVNEWRVSIYINFIDFEKAFDSVHRQSLWFILKSYGIPDRMIKMIKDMYDGFECAVTAVIDGNERSEWFKIKTGVKQGCMMSGFLFLMEIDWAMTKATADKRNTMEFHICIGRSQICR